MQLCATAVYASDSLFITVLYPGEWKCSVSAPPQAKNSRGSHIRAIFVGINILSGAGMPTKRFVNMNRKLFYLLYIVLLLSPGALKAQESLFAGERSFAGGLVLGANLSQIDGDAYYGYNKLGLVAGGIVYWNFNSRLGASLEILYSRKGVRGIDHANSPYVGPYFGKYYLQANYAEVPLILHYYITPKYHLGIGASYNQLINSSERYEGIDIYEFKPDQYPMIKSNIDFVANASMVLWQGLLVDVRYQYSITPIRKAEHVPQGLGYGGLDQMNNMFAIRMLYLF